MKPLIGITSAHNTQANNFYINPAYINAIIASGGIPVVLTPIPTADIPLQLSILDGLLLTGGGDINPLLLNHEPIAAIGEISTLRDIFELKLTALALEAGMAILGVCRGLQVLCAASGGELIQDISSQTDSFVCHNQKAPRNEETHSIFIEHGTILHRIASKDIITVNSLHHQAVFSCGKGFVASAHANDGIIEAIEGINGFQIGIQWHAENLCNHSSIQKNIFKEFVAVAQSTKKI